MSKEHAVEIDTRFACHCPDPDNEGCWCPDDALWGRLLGDDDPCAPGKDWAAAAFTEGPIEL